MHNPKPPQPADNLLAMSARPVDLTGAWTPADRLADARERVAILIHDGGIKPHVAEAQVERDYRLPYGALRRKPA